MEGRWEGREMEGERNMESGRSSAVTFEDAHDPQTQNS